MCPIIYPHPPLGTRLVWRDTRPPSCCSRELLHFHIFFHTRSCAAPRAEDLGSSSNEPGYISGGGIFGGFPELIQICWTTLFKDFWNCTSVFLLQSNRWTHFHAQKALFKVPKICTIKIWIENSPHPPLALSRKFIWFSAATLPLELKAEF